MALLVSKRGTCKRLQVGSVLTYNNKVISTGYNGPSKGVEHCNEFQCDKDIPCRRAIHAEHNAIISAPSNYLPGAILYVTHQPCFGCACKIIDIGITTVYYLNEYRDKAGLNYLLENNIKVIRINEAGETQDQS